MRVTLWIFAAAALLFNAGARADTLDDIKKRGEMIIGLEAAYVPYDPSKTARSSDSTARSANGSPRNSA